MLSSHLLPFVYDPVNQAITLLLVKIKVIPQQAEVPQGIASRLRSRIFMTFGTTRVVGRRAYAPAAFTPG